MDNKPWTCLNLGRTTKESMPKYPNDGYGRDVYISYNNAGIWKDNIKEIKSKPMFEGFKYHSFHSLKRYPPSWKYIQDGTGRDFYIIKDYGGLINFYTPLSVNYHNCLFRSEAYPQTPNIKFKLSKYEKQNQLHLQKIQKGIINRLYLKEKFKIMEKNKMLFNKTNGFNPALRSPTNFILHKSSSCHNLNPKFN